MRSNTTARIARRRSFRVAAAVLTAAAALTLTACNNDTGAAGSGSSSGSSGSSGGAQGSDAKGKGGEQAAAEGGGRAHAGVERCRTENLEAAFATGEDALPDRDGDGGATTASIVLINKSTSSCRIGGFPGVDLTSINGGERWSLAR
ncbi:flagellar motor protein MotB, partial [Streptomyces sp. NPDC005970]